MAKKFCKICLTIFCIIIVLTKIGIAKEPGLIIAQGSSTLTKADLAIQEAAEATKKILKGSKVQYAMVTTSVGYDHQKMLSTLKKEYGRNVKIWGLTSYKGVMTREGWQKGKGLSLMAFSSEKMKIGVGSAEIGEDPKLSGEKAVISAIKDAGKTLSDQPKLVLMTSAFGHEEKLLEGIERVVGKDARIFGGASGDDDLSGQWRQLSTDRVYHNGVVVTVFYTGLKIGYMFGNGVGYNPTTKKGIVTKAKGRTIYEIDNKPAGVVYNQWLDNTIADKVKNGGSLMFEGILDPLTQTIKSSTGTTFNLTIHAIEVKKEDKSLVALACTEVGQEISLLHGSPETHFNRPPIIAVMSRTAGHIGPDEIAGTFFICCACTHMVLEDKVGGFIPMVNQVLNNAPFLGAFTFGEQGYIPGVGHRHQNLITSMIVFGK